MSGRRVHRGAALGVAAGGVLLGHWLTYRLASPQAHARDALLARTGHAYLGIANDLGIALAVAAVAAIFLGHLTHRDHAPVGLGRWFVRLACFQAGAFLAMEILERLFSGTPLGGLMQHGLLPAGVAVQIAVAAGGALAIRWLLRAAERVRDALSRPVPLPTFAVVARLSASHTVPAARPLLAAGGIRGPPPR